MGMGFAPTWLRQVSPLLHMTILTTALRPNSMNTPINPVPALLCIISCCFVLWLCLRWTNSHSAAAVL